MQPPTLTGRNVLLTGASRGFGREIARHLARAGANMALLARDAEGLEKTCELARGEAQTKEQAFIPICADLADLSSLDRIVASAATALGGIDVLVNNAAIQGPIGPFETLDPDAWRSTFTVDFLAPAELCRLVIPHMKKRGGGKIVNISGGGATGPRADFSAYASAKAALVRLSETLADELRADRIDVNCVAPGAMNTRMLDEIVAAGPAGARHEHTRALDQVQAGGTPPEVGAELVVFLAGAESDGISGRLLSALWDNWRALPERREELAGTDVYCLRRIVPEDRRLAWP